ncbi:MAG: tetratricopeptide repeat protein [Planctomycetales bacterium]
MPEKFATRSGDAQPINFLPSRAAMDTITHVCLLLRRNESQFSLKKVRVQRSMDCVDRNTHRNKDKLSNRRPSLFCSRGNIAPMIFGLTKAKAHAKLQRAFASRDFTDAIAAYRKLIAKTPFDHELLNNLGIAYMESGELPLSIEAFREANRILPASTHLNNLGRALLEQKDHDGARAAFVDARKFDPTDPQPWYNLTVSLREEGRLDEAHRELAEFLRAHPTHGNGMNDLGCHHLDRGEFADAINCFAKAVDNNPATLSARLNLIRLLCDAKRYPDATPHLEALAQQGLNVKVHGDSGAIAIDLDGSPFYRTKDSI